MARPAGAATLGVLRRLSSKIPTYNIFAFDVETTGRNNDFLMGSIAGKNHIGVFWDRDEMIDCLMSKKKFYNKSRVFATNLAFDFTALFQKTEHIKRAHIIPRGSRFIQVKIPLTQKKIIVMHDTFSFCPFSVKKLGDIIGLPKHPTPAYIKEERMPREDEMDSIQEYNVRDSEITLRFADFLQSSLNAMGCKMRMTAASTSLDLFKRRYLVNPMWQENRERIGYQYKAYYGGRVEVFKRGLIRDANYYDFNSLYPSVMRNEFPDVSSSTFTDKGRLNLIHAYHGIAEVKMICPDDIDIPLLPSRQANGKLIFPTGCISGWHSHIELRKALEMGYRMVSIGRQIYYTRSHHPFKEFVEKLYDIRKAKKEAGDSTQEIVKLMMNSLYGKFGQKMSGKQKIFHMDNITKEMIDEMDKRGKTMQVNDYLYFTDNNPMRISSHIMPIYAVYAAAYGRLKMHEAMKDVNPIYIDTDSIITHEELPTSGELGQLKKEYSIKEAIIIRPKMYALKTTDGESVIRVKGNNASWEWDYDRFKSFIANPKVSQRIFSSFKMSNRKGIPYNTILDMDKEFGLEDNKRIWEGMFNPMVNQSSKPISCQ